MKMTVNDIRCMDHVRCPFCGAMIEPSTRPVKGPYGIVQRNRVKVEGRCEDCGIILIAEVYCKED